MYPFLGELSLTLGTDKRRYEVGEAPKYILQAGIPGSRVVWTSFKNGAATGEFNADYGSVIGANGTAELSGNAWTDADAGQWEKQALVIAPDGTQQLVQTFFTVSPKAAASPSTPAPAASAASWLSGETDLFGTTIPLPPVVTYVGGGLLAVWALKALKIIK